MFKVYIKFVNLVSKFISFISLSPFYIGLNITNYISYFKKDAIINFKKYSSIPLNYSLLKTKF